MTRQVFLVLFAFLALALASLDNDPPVLTQAIGALIPNIHQHIFDAVGVHIISSDRLTHYYYDSVTTTTTPTTLLSSDDVQKDSYFVKGSTFYYTVNNATASDVTVYDLTGTSQGTFTSAGSYYQLTDHSSTISLYQFTSGDSTLTANLGLSGTATTFNLGRACSSVYVKDTSSLTSIPGDFIVLCQDTSDLLHSILFSYATTTAVTSVELFTTSTFAVTDSLEIIYIATSGNLTFYNPISDTSLDMGYSDMITIDYVQKTGDYVGINCDNSFVMLDVLNSIYSRVDPASYTPFKGWMSEVSVSTVFYGIPGTDDIVVISYDACTSDSSCFSCSNDDIFQYSCASCNPGYELNGDRCDDIDECSLITSCNGMNLVCDNTEGSYNCLCNGDIVNDNFNCPHLVDATSVKLVDLPTGTIDVCATLNYVFVATTNQLYYASITSLNTVGPLTSFYSVSTLTGISCSYNSDILYYSYQFGTYRRSYYYNPGTSDHSLIAIYSVGTDDFTQGVAGFFDGTRHYLYIQYSDIVLYLQRESLGTITPLDRFMMSDLAISASRNESRAFGLDSGSNLRLYNSAGTTTTTGVVAHTTLQSGLTTTTFKRLASINPLSSDLSAVLIASSVTDAGFAIVDVSSTYSQEHIYTVNMDNVASAYGSTRFDNLVALSSGSTFSNNEKVQYLVSVNNTLNNELHLVTLDTTYDCALNNPCNPLRACSAIFSGFVCGDCPSGYVNSGDYECVDYNECLLDDPCSEYATCTNLDGSFNCSCNTGYIGDGLVCGPEQCGSGCAETLTNEEYGYCECVCSQGYSPSADGSNCTNINECETGLANCDSLAECVDTEGSYNCICPSGYNSINNGWYCEDINECQTDANNCADEGSICLNTPGSFRCECLSGYEGNGVTCTKIEDGTVECGGGVSGVEGYCAEGDWISYGDVENNSNLDLTNIGTLRINGKLTNTGGSISMKVSNGEAGIAARCADLSGTRVQIELERDQVLEEGSSTTFTILRTEEDCLSGKFDSADISNLQDCETAEVKEGKQTIDVVVTKNSCEVQQEEELNLTWLVVLLIVVGALVIVGAALAAVYFLVIKKKE